MAERDSRTEAAEYVQEIVEINRRYGLGVANGDSVTRAVDRVASIFDRLSPAAERPTSHSTGGRTRRPPSQASA